MQVHMLYLILGLAAVFDRFKSNSDRYSVWRAVILYKNNIITLGPVCGMMLFQFSKCKMCFLVCLLFSAFTFSLNSRLFCKLCIKNKQRRRQMQNFNICQHWSILVFGINCSYFFLFHFFYVLVKFILLFISLHMVYLNCVSLFSLFIYLIFFSAWFIFL